MGVSEMTHMSYLLIAMAVVFGCVSIVMYFVFDIRRCWRIVRGVCSVAVREKAPVGGISDAVSSNFGVSNSVSVSTEKKGGSFICQKTERLALDKTETLFAFEDTAPFETMTLVQDIVMMTDTIKTDGIMTDSG